MNRYGHCAGDKPIRRIDISLESTLIKNEQVLPSHIKKRKHLVSDLAWDNFDINTEACLFIILMEFTIKYKPMQQ